MGVLTVNPMELASRRLVVGVVLSFLFHVLLLLAIRLPTVELKQEQLVELTLEPAPARTPTAPIEANATPPRRQIVSPSETTTNKPPPDDTPYLAERDSSVEKETIRRGDPLAGSKQDTAAEKVAAVEPSSNTTTKRTSPTQSTKAPPTMAQERKTPDPASKQAVRPSEPKVAGNTLSNRRATVGALRLNDEVLARDFSASEDDAISSEDRLQAAIKNQQPASDNERASKFEQHEPFRPSSAGALLSGRRGSAEFLPNIPDGDITMLNAKADRHAVFVRRVALQVFGALRAMSWAELPYSVVKNLRDDAVVEAVLSPEGKLLKVTIQESSGVTTFDGILQQAARKGGWDQNPPATARASDGNIHFVFKARTWARRVGEGGTQEQRWLLLGTGLL